MKFPGSIGVMIIIISFFGVAFISAIEITPINKENTDYEYKPENLLKDQSEVKLSEYQDYVIPKEEKNKTKAAQHITLFDKGRHYSADNATLAYSEATPLKTILNSLKYSENCQSIIVDFNLKIEEWKEQGIKYPTTPILCTYKTPHHLIPVGFNGSYDYLTNVIFEYTPGDAVINLKNYDDGKYIDSTYLAIDNLFIEHHYDKLAYHKGFSTFELKTEESDYIIKWCEKQVKNSSFSNPIIDLGEYPNLYSNIDSGQYSYKVNLSNFTKYGDELTINAIPHKITNNQIMLGKPYDLKNIDIFYENKNCILKLNDIDKTVDLGPICNYKITGSGDWAFESKFYEGNHTSEIIGHKLDMNPFALFNINNSFIITFIGTVIILSGLCALSVGLNFIDLAVIISIIAFILVVL